MLIYITLIVSLLYSSFSIAKSVTWLKVDFAPYYILQGQNLGQGRDEGVIELLHAYMPDYDFIHDHVPSSRALYELKVRNTTTCILSLHKTIERQEDYFFSKEHSTFGLAPTVSLSAEILKSLNTNALTSVSLNELVFKHALMLGKSKKRSYGEKVDNIINKIPKDRIIDRAGKDSLKSLTYMLLKKRIDLIIGYPGEHVYLQSRFKQPNNLIQMQISEAPKTVLGFIGCNKRPKSKQFLSQVELALKKMKQSDAFIELMLRWVPDSLKSFLIAEIHNFEDNIKTEPIIRQQPEN